MTRHLPFATLGAVAIACSSVSGAQRSDVEPTWRAVATATDEVRVDEWENSLVSGVLLAAKEGYGDLYQQDRALYSPTTDEPQRSLPEGLYSCSSIQMSKQAVRGLAYIQYQPFRCRVTMDGGTRVFENLSGSQRTKGVIYDAPDMDGDVYLGTWQVSDDTTYYRYGEKGRYNEGALVQSLTDGRWRMIFPGALVNGSVEMLELKPLPDGE